MALRLSYSQIKTYSECGEKFRLSYRENLKEKFFHSALAFGSSNDSSLNKLLESKMMGYIPDPNKTPLELAKEEFDKSWSQQWLNGTLTELKLNPDVVYADKDFDEDLLSETDIDELSDSIPLSERDDPERGNPTAMSYYTELKEKKKEKGFDNFTEEERSYYNHVNWLCLRKKGHVMLESYNSKIMPKIKEVLAVQKKFELSNGEDIVLGFVDLVAIWHDGRRLLLDNKTAARAYEDDQASRSQQLIIYYHELKEEYKLDPAVGFIVMGKQLVKNKTKVCGTCGHNGSDSKARSCDNEVDGKRCKAEWLTHVSPECYIQVIINDVTETAENLVLDSFDDATTGIKNEYYYKNLSQCKNGFQCPFLDVCWKGDYSNVVKNKK